MKGVSSVIAIILILMIVVALAALAYTWFTGIFASLTSTTSTAVTSATGAMATQFRIEVAKYNSLSSVNYTIRNTGTQTFNVTKTSAYIAGAPTTCTGTCWTCTPSCGSDLMVPVGGTVNYGIANQTAACVGGTGNTLSVTIATGLTDSRTLAGC